MIDWLNTVLFTIGNDAVTWAELLGFVTGGLCVWLTVRAHIANFPVGIVNSALFLVLFVSARLWADASLQIVFIVLGFVGWWQWLYGRSDVNRARQDRAIELASGGVIVALFGGVLGATALLACVLTAAHDVAPFWDALTTALSLAAQYLLNARKAQTWWFWIAADVIYVPLYASKRLDLTATVYVLFLGMCIAGWRAWRRELAGPAGQSTEVLAVTS